MQTGFQNRVQTPQTTTPSKRKLVHTSSAQASKVRKIGMDKALVKK